MSEDLKHSNSVKKVNGKLNVEGPVSKSIGFKLRETRKEFLKNARKPHPATFRGWQEFTGFEKGDELTPTDEVMDLLTKATTLEQYLPEFLYGDWYHGVGIIIVSCFLCTLLGYFKFSVGTIFFLTLATALFYRTSVRKYRLNLRLEAQREFSVKAIEDDFESLDWLNVFLDKYWKFLEPSISEQVCDQVNQMIPTIDGIPAFVKELWIHTLTLGTKPPRIDKVRTLDRTSDDVTVMDWWVSMIPNTMEDSTLKQMKNKANQEVIIKAKMFGLTVPICVNDFTFKAKIRVRIRMMPKFPHIQTVNISLTEQPYFDFMARPVGSDSIFSWEIFNVPGLYVMVNELFKKYVGPIVFSPLSFQLNLEQLLAGNGVNGALGVLQIDVKKAYGLVGADTFNNTIDPYFTFGFSGSVLAKTKVVEDTINPIYNETIRVILNSSADPLAIFLYDENENDGRKDKFMGGALFDLDNLMSKGCINNVKLPILRNNKEAGIIEFDIKLMRSLQGSKLPDGSYSPPPDYNTGVVNLKLLGARDYSVDEDKPTPIFCEVLVSGELINTSKACKTAEAKWNQTFEDIVYDRSKTEVQVILREATKEKTIVGSSTLPLTDIIDASFVGNSWFSMHKGRGEVNLSCNWNSVKIPGVKGSTGYTEPVGIVRIYIENASQLLNLEKFGVIDPYVRVLINDVQKGRTLTKGSTTNPIYNESIFIPVSSINQRISIEALDVSRHTQDRTLGSLQLRLNEFVDFDSKNQPIITVGEMREGRLYHRQKGAKGIVNYSVAYYPVEQVATPKEVLKAKKENEKKLAEIKAKEEDERANNKGKKSKNEITQYDLEKDTKQKREFDINELDNIGTGVLVYTIKEIQTPQVGYFQIFFDKRGYAVSQAAVGKGAKPRFSSDYLVKELKYSLISFRIANKVNENYLENNGTFITMKTSEFIKKSYDNDFTIDLGKGSSVTVTSKFLPVTLESLPEADSIGNSGKLNVTVLNAAGLPAADSNGKSDPFAKIYLNGEQVYKTKTKKKTLEPEYNESFELDIDSRVQSLLRVKLLDWDFGVEQDDYLCENTLALKRINPFSETPVQNFELQLLNKSGGPAGTINLQFEFKPEYKTIVSAEKQLPNAANLAVDGAGRIIGTGVDGAGKVLGTAGKIGSSVGKLLKIKK